MKKKQTLILLSQMGSDILHLCKSNFFQQIKNTVQRLHHRFGKLKYCHFLADSTNIKINCHSTFPVAGTRFKYMHSQCCEALSIKAVYLINLCKERMERKKRLKGEIQAHISSKRRDIREGGRGLREEDSERDGCYDLLPQQFTAKSFTD